jgi:hypothetical protein
MLDRRIIGRRHVDYVLTVEISRQTRSGRIVRDEEWLPRVHRRDVRRHLDGTRVA